MKNTQTCLLITQKISSLCDFCISLNFNFCKICAFPFLLNIVKNGKAWQKSQQNRETRYLFSCWKWSQMSNFWWLFLHHDNFLLAFTVYYFRDLMMPSRTHAPAFSECPTMKTRIQFPSLAKGQEDRSEIRCS